MSSGRPNLISDIARWLCELMVGIGLAGLGVSDEVDMIVPPAPVAVAAPAAEHVPAPAVAAPADSGPRDLGAFEITFYYVIGEDEVAAQKRSKKPANDNHSEELADIEETREVTTIYSPRCEPIAQVQPEFASALALQGTGKLHDGRVVNISGGCRCEHSPCFEVTENQWGNAGSGRPLQPFRTVAVDPKVVKLGSLLYVPLLEGRTMPGRPPWGGFVHDGCVVADDTGGHIDGNRLDLFVGRKGYFLGLSGTGSSHAWARHVPVYDGSKLCQRTGRHVSRKTGSI
jgi:3D (Asp-Asp-Asp) domain-containing protein